MQQPKPKVPWLIEVCPASTLKKMALYSPYKCRDSACQKERQNILKEVCNRRSLRIEGSGIAEAVIGDWHGDALDSVIAAAAAFHASKDNKSITNLSERNLVEGWVFV